MSNINQDLQATHRILTIIEQSKSHNDELLDHLPGIFAIIDKKSRVLRANDQLASYLGLGLEDIIGVEFPKLFKPEVWQIFNSKLEQLETDGNEEKQFELEVIVNNEEKTFYWHISKFTPGKKAKNEYYSIVGEDISELRKKERQLLEIFSSIPLGILTVGPDKKIESQYSQFTEVVLETGDLDGKSLEETLFKNLIRNGDHKEKDGALNVVSCIGENDLIYESLRTTFPSEIWFPLTGKEQKGRWIGITYQPVVFGGDVRKLLVILEDRTAIVESKKALEETKVLEDQGIARILQIKRSDPNMLPLFIKEISGLKDKLEEHAKSKDVRELCNVLHSIKGNARVAGFEFLTLYTHDLETFVMDNSRLDNDQKWEQIRKEVERISSEWNEILSLNRTLNQETTLGTGQDENLGDGIKDLFDRYSRLLNSNDTQEDPVKAERMMLAIKSLNYSSLESLEDVVLKRVEKTAEDLNKKVKINFDWDGIRLEDYSKTLLSECLVHIVNNSVDHGIENPDDRLSSGKPEVGQIRISAKDENGMIHLEIKDDGKGISFPSIVRNAVKKKIISLDQVAKIDRAELLGLILKPGFSTSEDISEVSGRGVGMDVVSQRIKELGGAITLDTQEGKGTFVFMKFRSGRKTEMHKSTMPIGKFKDLLFKNLKLTADELNTSFIIKGENNLEEFEKGVVYGDVSRLILSCTTYIGSFCKPGGKYEVSLMRKGKVLRLVAETIQDGDPTKVMLEYFRPLNFCLEYIKDHKGSVLEEDSSISIDFGNVIEENDIPELSIACQDGINPKDAEVTINRIREVQEELNIPIQVNVAPTESTNLLITSNSGNQKGVFLTLGASKASLQKEIRKKIESILSALDKI